MSTSEIHAHSKTCDSFHYRSSCGNCGRQWCCGHDPAPSAMCHWCNGRGYSLAPWTVGEAISSGRMHAAYVRSLDARLELLAQEDREAMK